MVAILLNSPVSIQNLEIHKEEKRIFSKSNLRLLSTGSILNLTRLLIQKKLFSKVYQMNMEKELLNRLNEEERFGFVSQLFQIYHKANAKTKLLNEVFNDYKDTEKVQKNRAY